MVPGVGGIEAEGTGHGQEVAWGAVRCQLSSAGTWRAAGLEAACGGRPPGPVKLRVEVVGLYQIPAYTIDTSLPQLAPGWEDVISYARAP